MEGIGMASKISKKLPYHADDAFGIGVKKGMVDVIVGQKHGTAPIRLYKVVGSPVTDRAVRYADVGSFKRDVLRGKHKHVRIDIAERFAADK